MGNLLFKRLLVLILPSLFVPALFFLNYAGFMGFGGGRETFAYIIPLFFWSITLIPVGLTIDRKSPISKSWVFKSAIYSILITMALMAVLYYYDFGKYN